MYKIARMLVIHLEHCSCQSDKIAKWVGGGVTIAPGN